MNPVCSTSTFSALDLEYPRLKGDPSQTKRILDQYGLDAVVLPNSQVPKGFLAGVKRAFGHLEDFYHNTVPYYLRERIKWIQPLCKKIYKLISHIVKMALLIFDAIHNTAEATVSKASNWLKYMRKLKILSAFSGIGILYNLAINIKEFVKSIFKKDCSSGVDSGLCILDNVSDLTSIADTIISGLKEFGVVAATEAVKTASTALIGVSTVLSFAMIAYHSKQWYHTAHFRSTLEQKFGDKSGKNGDFKAVVDHLDGLKNSTISTRLGIKDGGELKVRLHAILQRDIDKNTPETKDNVKQAMAAMKKRLITKEVSSALKILACVISIVASAVLMFTPIAPLGFALFAISTTIGISILVADYVTTMQFNKTMRRLAPENLSFPEKPKMPPLEKKNDPEAQKRYAREIELHEKKRKSYIDEMKYVAPVKLYKWKHHLKKGYRKKMSNIIRWNPKKRDAANALIKDIQQESEAKQVQLRFLNKASKPNKSKLAAMEKEVGGMTLEEIKAWHPPAFKPKTASAKV